MPPGDLAGGPDVGHGYGLAAGGVVGHGHDDAGDVLRPVVPDEGFQPVQVHVAFEGVLALRVHGLGGDQVDRPAAGQLHVGPGGVEEHVAQDVHAGAGDEIGQDHLLGAAA